MRSFKKVALVIIDIFSINVAYIIAFSLIYYDIPRLYFDSFKRDAIIISLIYIVIFYIMKLYESLWNYASIDELMLVVGANILSGVVSTLFGYTLGSYIPINVHIIAVVMSTVLTLGFRLSFRIYRRGLLYVYVRHNRNVNRVMVVGAGACGNMIIKEMLTIKEKSYNPVVIIDDSSYKKGKSTCGVKVMGNRHDIERISKEQRIDTILIAIPSLNQKSKAEIINICKKTGCKLQIIPGLYELLNGQAKLNTMRNVSVQDLLGRDQIKLDDKGISEYIHNKVVMVTGGGGSIGSELCRQIAIFKPKELIIFDIYENNAYDIQNELKYNFPSLNLKVLIGSIRDKKRLDIIFSKYKPEVVFNAAAHKHVPLMEVSPGEAIKNNVFGTLNLAETADKYGVKKFVMISTDKAVNPTNVMGATKRICEMIVQAMDKVSKTEFVAVRFGNVLGSNGSVIPLFKNQIAKGGPLTLTHKEITRFFMLIPEAAQLVIQAGAYAKGGEIFVLDMGSPIKIYDLATDLIKLSGLVPNEDIEIKVTGLRPGEKLYEELLMSEEGLEETRHDKIFIGRPTYIDIEELKTNLNSLKFILDNDNSEEIKDGIKQMVPTYKEATLNETKLGHKDKEHMEDIKACGHKKVMAKGEVASGI
ncbi:capsular polysaccharide biosynthesis protein [Clostridium putrefaciens]|uniref:Capsular polysaccharide biosynthesis protein n=1 Tax=Clostridium putrefaciens TaxID=99675 RepID=A0A381J586_9CLOT|nr:nucleoside-diphosphate sugar epimerase/dehydratase [Clostridium putrefaciens]SUY45797.1 capsular polysaccharide biosynthesis protein [Clostridium putrefaciens]